MICDYDHKIISFSTTNENDVKFLKDKKQLYGFQKPLIDSIYQQLRSKNYHSLYLYGNFNIGKTYIMILFANELAASNFSVSFVDMPKISRMFKKANT